MHFKIEFLFNKIIASMQSYSDVEKIYKHFTNIVSKISTNAAADEQIKID